MNIDTFIKTMPVFSEIQVAHIVSDLKEILSNNLKEIDTILAQADSFTWENLMSPLESLEERLHQFWSPISHLNAVMNEETLRETYEICLPLLSDYGTQIAHNKKLYEAIKSLTRSDYYVTLDKAQKKIIEHNLRDFQLAGVALPESQKIEFARLTKSLSELANTFDNHVLDATNGWVKLVAQESMLSGVPQLMRQQFQAAAKTRQLEGWLITLEMPSYQAVMTYADSRDLRREVYEAYTTRASDQGPNAHQWDNTEVIYAILKNRLEMARLLGFEHYAKKSLATKMVHDPAQVMAFLNDLVTASLPKAKEELVQLKTFARNALGLDDFYAWDVAYASEKLRKQAYDISQEELRPYFPETQVVPGLFAIVKKLFGVDIELMRDVDVWHPDVRVYGLYDREHQIIGAVYFDLYARSHKRGGAWMDDSQVRRRLAEGDIQLPIAYVTCNFNGPVEGKPALFQHDDVVTLFHEFGHALQHLLTQVDYAEVSGIHGVPWDAVEVSSQFLENWAWERESVYLLAKHYETNEALPEALFEKMQRAKNFQSAMMMMRQLEFALFDFKLHLAFQPEVSGQVQTILNEVREAVCVLPVPPFNRFQNTFCHIFSGGYAAGYYSYKWAEVMAADAFELFLEKGIFDSETSQRFKETFLAQGGAEEPAELFRLFRGRAPSVNALLRQSGITS